MFAEKGYTAIEIDIQPPPYSPLPFAMMVGALATEIRLLAIPFPPVIVAEGMGCLLTQSYIGDNPASGLVMVNPPPDADPRKEKGAGGSWEWPVFNYEPHFPILVIAEKSNLPTLQSTNRVVKAAEAGVGRGGKGVSVEELVDGPRGEKSRVVSHSLTLCLNRILNTKRVGGGEMDGSLWLLKRSGNRFFRTQIDHPYGNDVSIYMYSFSLYPALCIPRRHHTPSAQRIHPHLINCCTTQSSFT